MFEKTLLTICLVVSGLCFSAFAGREHIKQVAHKMIQALVPAVDQKQQQELEKQTALLTENRKLLQKNTELLGITQKLTTINAAADTGNKVVKRADSLHLAYALNYGVTTSDFNIYYHYRYANEDAVNLDIDTIWHLNHKGDTVKHVKVRANINIKADPKVIANVQPKIDVQPKVNVVAKINANPKVNVVTDHKVDVNATPDVNVIVNPKVKLDSLGKLKGALSPKLAPSLGKLGDLDTTRKPVFVRPQLFSSRNQYQQMMVKALVKDGIIDNENSPANWTLSDSVFTVNGKKQSKALRDKYEAMLHALPPPEHPSTAWIGEGIRGITADLKKDGIVPRNAAQNDVSFTITKTEFIVNGKKQPDAIFKKYHEKYIKPLSGQSEGLTWNMGGVPFNK